MKPGAPTRLVLLGGGHAHALVLLKFRKFISKNLEVVLVSPAPLHVYSGMVPGVIAGHYAAADARIDLARLAHDAGAEFIRGRVLRIDPGAKQVELVDGDSLRYDILSLNLGSLPAGIGDAGVGASAIPAKPFDEFFARWQALLERGPAAPRIAVAGAGAAGAEIAMAVKYALDRRGSGGSVSLFSERDTFAPAVAERLRGAIDRLGVELRANTRVAAVDPAFDATFWATGASALPLLRESGLGTDPRGYVLVDGALRSVTHPDVFAAGDTAAVEGANEPRSGVYAVRQAPVLAENLKRVVRGAPMLDYVHRDANLALISCGGKYAVASRGNWSAEGRWAWWWKDWLDRRWVAKFR